MILTLKGRDQSCMLNTIARLLPLRSIANHDNTSVMKVVSRPDPSASKAHELSSMTPKQYSLRDTIRMIKSILHISISEKLPRANDIF
jgi:hypothetical protein